MILTTNQIARLNRFADVFVGRHALVSVITDNSHIISEVRCNHSGGLYIELMDDLSADVVFDLVIALASFRPDEIQRVGIPRVKRPTLRLFWKRPR